MGAEVRLDAAIIPMIRQQRVPYLGVWKGQRVLWLEFPHGSIVSGAENLVEWLLNQDILPMIAHPERNKAVMRNPDRLQPFLALGCLVQITAGALIGQFGEHVQQVAENLLRQHIPTVLASDAHNLVTRPPNLSAGFKAAVSIVGEAAARELVYANPMQLFSSNAGI